MRAAFATGRRALATSRIRCGSASLPLGAATVGRRAPGPHARPAAPLLLHREASRREAAMTDASAAAVQAAAEEREELRRDLDADGLPLIAIPGDWPTLRAPSADGEPLEAYVKRAILSHALVASLAAGLRLSPNRPPSRTTSWAPADSAAAWRPWAMSKIRYERRLRAQVRQLAGDPGGFPAPQPQPTTNDALRHHLARAEARLLAQLFDHLKSGTWQATAVSWDGFERLPVPAGWWSKPCMRLDLARGILRPASDRELRRGDPRPLATAPTFHELHLHGLAAAAVASVRTEGEVEAAHDAATRDDFDENLLSASYLIRVRRWQRRKPLTNGPSEEQDVAWAERRMRGVTREQIRQIRKKHAPTEWTKPGPRKRDREDWREPE